MPLKRQPDAERPGGVFDSHLRIFVSGIIAGRLVHDDVFVPRKSQPDVDLESGAVSVFGARCDCLDATPGNALRMASNRTISFKNLELICMLSLVLTSKPIQWAGNGCASDASAHHSLDRKSIGRQTVSKVTQRVVESGGQQPALSIQASGPPAGPHLAYGSRRLDGSIAKLIAIS
jgi:hypothetical protein